MLSDAITSPILWSSIEIQWRKSEYIVHLRTIRAVDERVAFWINDQFDHLTDQAGPLSIPSQVEFSPAVAENQPYGRLRLTYSSLDFCKAYSAADFCQALEALVIKAWGIAQSEREGERTVLADWKKDVAAYESSPQ